MPQQRIPPKYPELDSVVRHNNTEESVLYFIFPIASSLHTEVVNESNLKQSIKGDILSYWLEIYAF